MPNRPQQPPPGFMVQEARTPNPADVYFRELVNRDETRWRENQPVKRGTLYSSLRGADSLVSKMFPELYFLCETVPIGSNTVAGMTQHEFVIWNWSTVPRAESPTNAEISFLGDAITNPVYARVYTVRRDEYDESPSIATDTPFTGLIGVRVLKGGQDYTQAYGTLRGPGEDSGAIVNFVVANGQVISAVIEDEGEDFDLTSTIDVIGDGTGAEAELILQPVGAVLTSQKKLEFAEDDPRQAEFVRVARVYELLPGPWLPFTRYDDDLGPVQGRKRAVINTGQRGGTITATTKTNYESRDGSSVVLMQIEENWSDGTNRDGDNPPYPLQQWSTYEDPFGTIQHTSQIQASQFSAANATYVRANGKITKTWYEPYTDNPFLQRIRTDHWTDVTRSDFEVSSEHGGGVFAISETRDEPGVQVLDTGYLVPESSVTKISPHEQVKRTKLFYGLPGQQESMYPPLTGCHTDEKTGIRLPFVKQVIPAGTPLPAQSGYRGPFVEDQPYDRWNTIRIITTPDCSSLPPQEDFYITRPFSLPPILLSIEAVWSDQISYLAEAHAASVLVRVISGNRGGVIVTSRAGYRGYAFTKVSRFYKCGPFLSSEIPRPFKILPSTGSVVMIEAESEVEDNALDGETTNGGTSTGHAFSTNAGRHSARFEQRIHEIQIGEHLVGPLVDGPSGTFGSVQVLNMRRDRLPSSAFAQSAGGTTRAVGLLGGFNTAWGAQIQVRVPMSTPDPFSLATQPMNQILTEVLVEEWGYGIWVMERFYTDLTGLLS